MNYQYKQQNKSRLSKLYRRITKTEPMGANDQDQKVIQAKLYLLNLTKHTDQPYRSQPSHKLLQPDQSVSEWNTHHSINVAKISFKQPQKPQSQKHNDRKDQSNYRKQLLNRFQNQLISRKMPKPATDRIDYNITEINKRYLRSKAKINKVAMCIEQSQETNSPSQKRPKSIFIAEAQVKNRSLHVNGYVNHSVERSGLPINWTSQRQASQRLPRLQRMSPQNFKRKYKSIFRHNTQIKYSMPLQSPIGKQITRISDLIEEENIQLAKNYHRR